MHHFISRYLLFFFLSAVPGFANGIDRLVRDALQKHPSIQSIQHTLSSMDEKIRKSTNWKNPDLSLTLNDIRLDRPLDRGLEPMQFQSLSFKQRFPWFGKLDLRHAYATQQKQIIYHSLEAAKVALAREIRITAYTIKEYEARIRLQQHYIRLAKQNIALYTDYIATESMSHAQSVSAELSLSNIRIQKERYKARLQSEKEKLRYLVGHKITRLPLSLRMHKSRPLGYYLRRITHNPLYRMKQSTTEAADTHIRLKSLEKYPDPYVQVSYADRDAFPDYASVSVGVSLPLYGTEALDTEIARKEKLSKLSETIDYKASLESRIRQTYVKLKEAKAIHRIITQQSLPQLRHMLDLGKSAIEEGADLLTYTKILEEMLIIDEERIHIQAAYLKTEAELDALIGEK
jgi:cobalt-zinc-cadmium efflux system outer membrane protein